MTQQFTIIEPENKNGKLIKDLISLIALILGSILVSIGSFIALGLVWGLVVLGVLFIVISIIFGLK